MSVSITICTSLIPSLHEEDPGNIGVISLIPSLHEEDPGNIGVISLIPRLMGRSPGYEAKYVLHLAILVLSRVGTWV